MFKTSAPPTNLQELAIGIQQAVHISGGYKRFQRMYANDRVAFAYDCFGKVGKTLTFYQEEILSYFDEGFTRVAVRGPHGLGKTYLASILVHHGVLTAEDDAKVITTASAWRQVEKYLWPEIKKLSKSISWDMIGREPYDPNHEFLQMSIKLNYGTVEAFAVVSDDYQTIEGAHAKKLVYIFDEAKSIPRNTWNAAEGAFSNASVGKSDHPLELIDRGEIGLIEENVPYFNEDKPIADVWDMIMAGQDPDVGTDVAYNQGIKFDSPLAVYQPGAKKNKSEPIRSPMAKTMIDQQSKTSVVDNKSPEDVYYDDSVRDVVMDKWGEEIRRIEQDDLEGGNNLDVENDLLDSDVESDRDSDSSTHRQGKARQSSVSDRDYVNGEEENSRRSGRASGRAESLPIASHDAAVSPYAEHDGARALRGDRAPDVTDVPSVPTYASDSKARKDYAVPMGTRANDSNPMLVPKGPITHRGGTQEHVFPITDQAQAFAISTPGNPDGQFYDIHTHAPGYEDWHVRHVTLDDAIRAGRISRAWADQRARQWGQDSALFKNRVLGEFADSSEEGMIPLSWVRAANERWKAWRDRGFRGEEGYRSIGVDVARSGDDKTVFAERQRSGVRNIRVFSKLSTTTVAERLTQCHDGRYLHIEMDGGLGAAVYDILKRGKDGRGGLASRLLKPITVGAPTTWRDRSKMMKFLNVRAAMWWNMRDLLDPYYDSSIMLPPIEELTKDLTTPQYIDKGDNVIVLESKDSIRSRLGRSTDFGDAVCLAFWGQTGGGGVVI
jgi:hypothetical protein